MLIVNLIDGRFIVFRDFVRADFEDFYNDENNLQLVVKGKDEVGYLIAKYKIQSITTDSGVVIYEKEE